jgi:hypothetical protein
LRAEANDHTSGFLKGLFEGNNGALLAQGWRAGSIGPFKNLLVKINTINTIENKYLGLFLIYCIYFLAIDVPVYFDSKHPSLRENLAYHCIVGHFPF